MGPRLSDGTSHRAEVYGGTGLLWDVTNVLTSRNSKVEETSPLQVTRIPSLSSPGRHYNPTPVPVTTY